MHPKLKSTLSGLAVVTGFVFGSALLGEPLPTSAALAATGAVTSAEAGESVLPEAAGSPASRARENNRRRLHLTMPYFAIGRLLPHTGES